MKASLPSRLALGPAAHFAWRTLWQRFALFAGLLLTAVAAWAVLEVIVISGQRFGIVLWALAHLAFLVFFAGLEAGWVGVSLDLSAGRAPAFRAAFAHLALGPKLLAGQLVFLLGFLLGLLLLIVPGLYLAGRLALFSFCLVDGPPALAGSFRRSAALSQGVLGQLTLLFVALLLLNLLGACVLGVGLFLTVPFSLLLLAAVYTQLSAALPRPAHHAGQTGSLEPDRL